MSISYGVITPLLAATDLEKDVKKITLGGIYPLSPTGVDPGGRTWALVKKQRRGKKSPAASSALVRRDLPSVCAQNDGFLDLDVRAGRLYKLLKIDGRGPVGITLAPLEKGESLLKHRQRPIGGVERLRYWL